ncbi:Uu.00g001820.m01.CDS01 [Anthostomella pinea]|uniref:Uu.00g001820.m01.CDS01 n=1 Tax=Anthostomella pinea TaxID=933095 RepID=A0AAI8VE55_9PEZI|nr:Uu.00g001820.m01.CDS01 [Anthostomella pinea]
MAPRKQKQTKTKKIFKDCTVAIGGDLVDPQWQDASKVAKWTTSWGGTFNYKMDNSVTHLLCTHASFKKKIPEVKVALKNKHTHIVLLNWLEDSIYAKKRLLEKKFSLKEKQKESNAKMRRKQQVQKGLDLSVKYIDPNLYHIYRDSMFFEYQVKLTRDDEKNEDVGQKYVLTLWESNAKPHLYQTTAKFWKKHRDNKPAVLRTKETPRKFDVAFEDFKTFFEKKTGLLWDDRIAKAGTMPAEKFQYEPPTGGKPVGLVNGRTPSLFGDGNVRAQLPLRLKEAAKQDDAREDVDGSGSKDAMGEDHGRGQPMKKTKRKSGAEDEMGKDHDHGQPKKKKTKKNSGAPKKQSSKTLTPPSTSNDDEGEDQDQADDIMLDADDGGMQPEQAQAEEQEFVDEEMAEIGKALIAGIQAEEMAELASNSLLVLAQGVVAGVGDAQDAEAEDPEDDESEASEEE